MTKATARRYRAVVRWVGSESTRAVTVRETAQHYVDVDSGAYYRKTSGARCDVNRNVWRAQTLDLSTLEAIA